MRNEECVMRRSGRWECEVLVPLSFCCRSPFLLVLRNLFLSQIQKFVSHSRRGGASTYLAFWIWRWDRQDIWFEGSQFFMLIRLQGSCQFCSASSYPSRDYIGRSKWNCEGMGSGYIQMHKWISTRYILISFLHVNFLWSKSIDSIRWYYLLISWKLVARGLHLCIDTKQQAIV